MAKSIGGGESAHRTVELQLTGSDVSVAGEHLARGRAHVRGGNAAMAEAEFQAALAIDPDSEATGELAELRWPGRGYLAWLRHLQAVLSPRTYLEIGIEYGHSLATARPPTRAIGIDPQPRLSTELVAETDIFTETSDEFFAQRRLNSLLAGKPLDLVFIDGMHLFEQVLKDFMNVEKHCGNGSLVLLHDTLPINELTQRRTRTIRFYVGDVWKTVLCLKYYRPDLDIFTIAAPQSGLTIISGLDPASRVISENYEAAVARFIELPYSEIEKNLDEILNVVSNDWPVVRARLAARGIVHTETPDT